MDQEIQNKFEEQNKKLEEIFRSVEKLWFYCPKSLTPTPAPDWDYDIFQVD